MGRRGHSLFWEAPFIPINRWFPSHGFKIHPRIFRGKRLHGTQKQNFLDEPDLILDPFRVADGRLGLPVLPVTQNIFIEDRARPGYLDRGLEIHFIQANLKGLLDPVPFGLIIRVKNDRSGFQIRPTASELSVHMPRGEPIFKVGEQGKALFDPLQNRRYFPAMISSAESDFGTAPFQLLVQVLDTGKTSPVYVGPGLFKPGVTFKTDPKNPLVVIRNLTQVDMPVYIIHSI